MIVDARDLGVDTVLRTQVCVVGAGPAGLSLTRRLRERGIAVVLLESGSADSSVRGQRLNRGEVVDRRQWRLDKSRFRNLGGSGQRWGGWCRPLDPADLVDHGPDRAGGWPLRATDLAPYQAQARDVLDLPVPSPDRAATGLADEAGVDLVTYQFSPLRLVLGDRFRSELELDDGVTAVTGATVVDLPLGATSDRVDRVVAARHDGERFCVRADEVVLATGAVENARVLLTSSRDRTAGLGNEHDTVGRYFMDHLHVEAARLLVERAAGEPGVLRALDHTRDRADEQYALAGTAAMREREGLLAISMTLTPAPHHFGHPYLNLPPAANVLLDRVSRRLPAGLADAGDATLRRPRSVVSAIGMGRRRLAALRFGAERRRLERAGRDAGMTDPVVRSLYVRAEQTPNRHSRVSLGSAHDRFGVPVPRLDWRLAPHDTESVDRWITRLDEATAAVAGVQVLRSPGWTDEIQGGPHHMGTTRMSADPRGGVVDADGRVHSLRNLFVAGGSVFPSGGYANPTQTIVALALRLGDHLASRVAS